MKQTYRPNPNEDPMRDCINSGWKPLLSLLGEGNRLDTEAKEALARLLQETEADGIPLNNAEIRTTEGTVIGQFAAAMTFHSEPYLLPLGAVGVSVFATDISG